MGLFEDVVSLTRNMVERGLYVDDYKINSKHISVNGNKVGIKDFFKVDLGGILEDGSCLNHTHKGVDVSTFALYGMLLNVLESGHFCDERSVCEFLDYTCKFLSDSYSDEKLTTEDYVAMKHNLKSIYFNDYGISAKTAISKFGDAVRPSLYFAPCLPEFSLETTGVTLAELMYQLSMILLQDNDGSTLVELFAKFRSLNILGGSVLCNRILKGDEYDESCLGNISNMTSICRLLSTTLALSISDSAILCGISDARLPEAFKCCLGDDYLSKYLKGENIDKFFRDIEKHRNIEILMNDGTTYLSDVMNTWAITESHNSHFRYLLFKEIIWYKYLEGYCSEKVITNLLDYYKELKTKTDRSVNYYSKRNSELSKENKTIKGTIKGYEDTIKDLSCKLDAFETEKRFDKRDSTIARLEGRVSELEELLSQREKDIEELLLACEVDSDDLDISSLDVSLEEMVDFLSGFRICIVGGRDDFITKLNSLGMYNVFQVTNVTDMARVNSFDFMVSMTKFLSHKLFYYAKSKLGSNQDMHLYFNGTNAENFIALCYETIRGYLEN